MSPDPDTRLWPAPFVDQMQDVLNDDAPEFFEALQTSPGTSVIMNTWKTEGTHFENASQVPWCKNGLLLKDRPSFTLDPLWHAGAYYVMESSSMFLAEVLLQTGLTDRPVKLLDLCAAPGGKTTVVATHLHPQSTIIANEVNRARYRVLRQNVDKLGVAHIGVIQLDPSRIPFNATFDVVLVDAPCSGEGLFRKDQSAARHWSEDHIAHCQLRQRRILKEATRLLKPGGHLIYSTCTYNSMENMDQIEWLAHAGMRSVPLTLPRDWHITEVQQGNSTGYQFYPHRNPGEGLFCAIMQSEPTEFPSEKPQRFESQTSRAKLPQALRGFLKNADQFVYQEMNNTWYAHPVSGQSFNFPDAWRPGYLPGTELGTIKGKDFVPSHGLALSVYCSDDIPVCLLSKDQALTYLRRDRPEIHVEEEGWILAQYKGQSLGWMKNGKSGIKNYYPMNERIRSL